jgi:hypothetical protein
VLEPEWTPGTPPPPWLREDSEQPRMQATDDERQAMRELFTYDMSTIHAVCQYCAALVLPTDDGRRLHVAWHVLIENRDAAT